MLGPILRSKKLLLQTGHKSKTPPTAVPNVCVRAWSSDNSLTWARDRCPKTVPKHCSRCLLKCEQPLTSLPVCKFESWVDRGTVKQLELDVPSLTNSSTMRHQLELSQNVPNSRRKYQTLAECTKLSQNAPVSNRIYQTLTECTKL
ncbi:hypothetical protein BaRGS_00001963 [Batillaria attramentaria]|uniref:Uncharacterized protein n=1 Tax=Batillaria attramentaria TaxID=370345 RepID=A0ABD0M6H8_9CAEN